MADLVHHDEERHLIAALLARDRNAWSEFVQRFQGLVYARVARTAMEFNRRLDRSEIEDVCAEIFASLVENDCASLRRFEGRSSLTTWLAVISRRRCLKWMQRRIERQAHGNQRLEELPSPDLEAGGSEDILAAVVQTEDRDRLREMLQQLSDGDRSVLQRFFFDGYSYADISRELGISINTVGPKLRRAQLRLRKLMEADGSPSVEKN